MSISTTTNGLRGSETPTLTISNSEAYTTAIITIQGHGTNHTTHIQIPANGTINKAQFYTPPCSYFADQQFTVTVKLRDRAGNVGEPSNPSTFVIKQCPICGHTDGAFNTPFKNPNAYIGFFYGYSAAYFNYKYFHTGVDYNGIPRGTAVYPSLPGALR